MKTLVMYFSNTQTTARVAKMIANQLGADLYEIKAKQPYTVADLNWHNDNSRANQEQVDDSIRPELAENLPDISQYDRVIIGHPTWWGRPPRIIQTVLDNLDLSDKIFASFATSGGSSYNQAQDIMDNIPTKETIAGDVLNTNEAITKWIAKL